VAPCRTLHLNPTATARDHEIFALVPNKGIFEAFGNTLGPL
jgi:hypothetical protein